MAFVATSDAQTFVVRLNQKFHAYGLFTVKPGKRYDKIVVTPNSSTQTFVYAFVECETGHVFKPNGWTSPAKGVRFTSVDDAIKVADPYGSFLYAR